MFGHWGAFSSSSSVQVIPLDVTTPRDSYAWNYRELATLLTLSESLAEGRFEPLTIRSNIWILPLSYPDISYTNYDIHTLKFKTREASFAISLCFPIQTANTFDKDLIFSCDLTCSQPVIGISLVQSCLALSLQYP